MMQSTPAKHPTASSSLSTDRCGCAMGARFLGVALVASIGWFAWHWHEYSLARAGVRTLIFAFAGAVLGKLVGIAGYRLRARILRARSAGVMA
ncbi:MAG TPA: hypothetical protein VKB49_00420 [Candidatus Sulfotelmatobacter sp.]|nr:hypothetical protein [Candidatus Sulfotelmatobacter sp.]